MVTKGLSPYLLSKWKTIVLAMILFAIIGFLYSIIEKPVYTAELTFTSESEGAGNISAYAGIAAQFGLDLGGSSSNAFEGENLMRLMSSRKLIQKTLLTSAAISSKNDLLINYYIQSNFRKYVGQSNGSNMVIFTSSPQEYSRKRDSIFLRVVKDLSEALVIQKIDKRSDIISVKFKDQDELFAKTFVTELVNNVIQYYTEYKVKKSKQNVLILQHQTDSVRNLINGNIVDIAVSNDLNVNPTRQIVRTSIQRKQVDAQVNGALYTELVKNLELSKLSLRKETPLIQVIDTPILPLEKKKLGKLAATVLFAFTGVILTMFFFALKKVFSNTNPNLPL